MVPRCEIVPCPRTGEALGTGVGRSREHEGPLVPLQFAQAVIRRPGVLHAHDVMRRAVVDACAVIQTMPDVEWHGLLGVAEYRRFIHVIPKAGCTHVHEILV